MSEAMEDIEISPERQRVLEQRRANIAKARAAKINNRTAKIRTADDAKMAGVGGDPSSATRSQPTRETVTPEIVTRVRRDQRDSGWADLPQHRRKANWDYEWKVIRVIREPVDPSDMLEIRNAGWRAEKANDWPEMVEPGTSPDAAIESHGQRLYGRPMQLTMEARQEDLTEAYRQQRDKTLAASSGRSAVRGEEGIPNGRAVRSVPVEIKIEGLAG